MRLLNVDLSSAVEPGSTMVTPSPLLASAANEQIMTQNLQKGRTAWLRPEILGVNAWLTNCWREVRYKRTSTPALLSASQESALWQRLITRQYPNLGHQAGTARLAVDAARLIAEYRIPLKHEAWADYRDAQQFRDLFGRFRRLCKAKNWITCSDLWRLVPKWIAKNSFDPGKIVFAGFERFSPALDGIREALGHRASLAPVGGPEKTPSVWGKACADFDEEVEYVARWARQLMEENPNRSVGILIPDLATHYALVERTFRQVLYPSRAAGPPRGSSLFGLNGSKPLLSHPLIANALLLLELARPQIAMTDASAILRCPFIKGAAAEANSRALADIELRKRRHLDVTLHGLESGTLNCPVLTSIWEKLHQVLRVRSWTLDLPRWSQLIADLLAAVGWPGDAETTGEEGETVEKWKDALLDLAGLGLISASVTFDTACAHLRRLLASACGPQTGDGLSPIQILEAGDANGLEFDCAAVLGMSDETWPLPPKSWPFVPSKLRREREVPGSDGPGMQEERRRKTQSLFQSASTIFTTYSGRLAPLARSFLSSFAAEPAVWEGRLPVQSYSPAVLESIDDTVGPPFQLDEIAAGGVGIIKSQSLCPFRAFAEYRLHACRPEDGYFGIDARDRGSFLHKALEHVWKNLQTLERLQSLSEDELRELIRAAAFEAIQERPAGPFHQLTRQSERERLEALVLRWLLYEKERKTPFTVEHLEKPRSINLNGLQLELRIDRIDRLPDKSVILIDYKSSDLTLKDLEGSRPAEPQLLIYAAATEENVEGIYIAKTRPRQPESVGFAHNEHFPLTKQSRKKTSWAQLRDESRGCLHAIAAEFIRGYAAVRPERGACDYCDLPMLCRIGERTKLDEDENSFG
jgi:probable DNA repair protein